VRTASPPSSPVSTAPGISGTYFSLPRSHSRPSTPTAASTSSVVTTCQAKRTTRRAPTFTRCTAVSGLGGCE